MHNAVKLSLCGEPAHAKAAGCGSAGDGGNDGVGNANGAEFGVETHKTPPLVHPDKNSILQYMIVFYHTFLKNAR
jgi:hypothetical protein